MTRLFPFVAGAAMVAASAITGAATAQAQGLDSIRSACVAMGLDPSEAPFANCVASLQNSVPRDPRALHVAAGNGVTGLGYVTPSIGIGAQRACASIGLDPSTARFSYCVADLRQTMFDATNVGAR